MQIPNCNRAFVDLRKLRDYSLSLEHKTGRHKAKVFKEKLGLTSENAEMLYQVILDNVCNDDAQKSASNQFGELFTLDFIMKTPLGRAYVRTGWIIRNDEIDPRLTSCYVLPRKRVEDDPD